MSLFVSTRTSVNRHGVFAEERSTPSTIQAIGTATVCMLAQLPWGPDDQVIVPEDAADRRLIIAPPGMDRTGSGYMCQSGKAWPDLRLIRVLGSTAVKAQVALATAGPTTIANLIAKYKGTAGNSIVGTVANASDGNVNHFNLTVSVTGASGSTTELFTNLDFTNGQPTIENIENSRLIESVTWVANGRPTNDTYNLAGGTNGVIDATAYLGTPGSSDRGLALAEGDDEIDIVFPDDPGNALRAAVNAGLVAHAQLQGDRVCIINGNSAQTAVSAQTDVVNYQHVNVAYVDAWFYQRDYAGVTRLVAPACALATVLANLPPSTSAAWKAQEVRQLLGFIVRLEQARNASAGTNTQKGICTLIKEKKGGYTFEAAVNTQAPVNWSKRELHRSRMGIYVAKSLQDSLRESVDAPNVAFTQNDIIGATSKFMSGLKDNVKRDPVHNVHIVDWDFNDLKAENPTASVQAGDFTVPFWFETSAGAERIWLAIAWGPNAAPTVAAA